MPVVTKSAQYQHAAFPLGVEKLPKMKFTTSVRCLDLFWTYEKISPTTEISFISFTSALIFPLLVIRRLEHLMENLLGALGGTRSPNLLIRSQN